MINNSVQLVCAWVKVLFGGIAKNGIRGDLASFFALRYLVSIEERKEVSKSRDGRIGTAITSSLKKDSPSLNQSKFKSPLPKNHSPPPLPPPPFPFPYNLPLNKFPTISRPVTLVVAHSVGKSSVDDSVSAYPKNSIGGIQPRAYSSAKHAASILYCLTSPRRKWCTEPAG